MKLLKKTPVRTLFCIIAFSLCITTTSCDSDQRRFDKMKESIPDAAQFIEDFAESLAILVEMQEKLSITHLDFNISLEVSVYEYYKEGGLYSNEVLTTSLSDCDLLDEQEKQAVKDVLFGTGRIGPKVVVTPDYTIIYFDKDLRNKSDFSLFIDNKGNVEETASRFFHTEQINDIWYARITYGRRFSLF